MHIERDVEQRTITISNERMIADLLSRYGMSDANGKEVPITPGAVLQRDNEQLDQRRYPYSALEVCCIWLSLLGQIFHSVWACSASI